MKAEHSRRATNTHTQPTPTLSLCQGFASSHNCVHLQTRSSGKYCMEASLFTSHSAMVNPCLVDVKKKIPSYFWFTVKVPPSNRKLVQNNQGAIKNLGDLSEAHLDNFPHPGKMLSTKGGTYNMGMVT